MRTKILWWTPVALIVLVGAGWTFANDDEVEIALEDVPAVVIDAVKARFPDGKIVEAEMEIEDGETVYELEVEDDGAEFEVEVSADGTILEVEEDEDDDDEEDEDDD